MNDTFYLLKSCLQRIEEKLPWGSSKDWVNAHFISLSEKITAASRISISPHTLKRLYGKIKYKEEYNPQLETKNALAIFLGYTDWEDFVQRNGNRQAAGAHCEGHLAGTAAAGIATAGHSPAHTARTAFVPPARESLPPVRDGEYAGGAPEKKAASPRRVNRTAAVLGMVSVLAGVLFFLQSRPHFPAEPAVTFRGKHLKGFIPLTAIFNYDISAPPSDSVFIYFEGYNARRPLPRDKHTITQWYEFPGFYQVQLLARGKVLSSLGVHALSNGWKGIVASQELDAFTHITPPLRPQDGHLYVSPAQVQASRVDTNQRYWVIFRNVKDYAASGDDFTFEARVQNNSRKGTTICNDAVLSLTGAHHSIRVHFLKPGCSRWTFMQVGEVVLNGEYNDLSVLGRNLAGWRTIRLEVKDRTASVFFEGKLIYRVPYTQPVGPLKSISCEFLGCGQVDYVKLYNARRELVYGDDFDEPVQ